MTPTERSGHSGLRQTLFRMAALLLPLLILAAAEGAARLAGYGGYPPLIRRIATDGEHTWFGTNRAGTNSFFKGRNTPGGGMRELQFRTPRISGTVRILFLGESAIQGFPQPLPLTNGSFLEAMLFDAWHGTRRAEVLNLGATAMASYPVTHILREALEHQPDLVVLMVGNNEYYGAYGVVSLPPLARSPMGMGTVRALRGLGVSQWLETRLASQAAAGGALMERLGGDRPIAPASPLRRAAARNLEADLVNMVGQCRARGVPVLVCTSPTNERGLRPIGAGEDEARTQYLLGRTLTDQGRHDEASVAYVRARDADTMPWRATSAAQAAVRAAAQTGATLCDMEAAFRRASPGGAIGWELMDDHVHMSLRGQALFARTIAGAMTAMPEPLHVDTAELDRLPDWTSYARGLGHSAYSDYLAATHLKTLFNIPFMARSNPEALRRAAARCDSLRGVMGAADSAAIARWHDPALHGATERPVEFVVGIYRMAAGDYAGAAPLLRVARVSVSLISLWRLELTWRLLTCNRQLNEAPTAEDERLLRETIRIGELLRQNAVTESPEVLRYLGLAYNVAGNHASAVACLDKVVGAGGGAADAEVMAALVDSRRQRGQP